jgi:hypothetical protein
LFRTLAVTNKSATKLADNLNILKSLRAGFLSISNELGRILPTKARCQFQVVLLLTVFFRFNCLGTFSWLVIFFLSLLRTLKHFKWNWRRNRRRREGGRRGRRRSTRFGWRIISKNGRKESVYYTNLYWERNKFDLGRGGRAVGQKFPNDEENFRIFHGIRSNEGVCYPENEDAIYKQKYT